VQPAKDCEVKTDWTEIFPPAPSLEWLGWSAEGSSIGSFSLGPGAEGLGPDLCARLDIEASVQGGKACVTSPFIVAADPKETCSLTFEQALVGEAPASYPKVELTVFGRPLGVTNLIPLATFDGLSLDPATPFAVELPDKLKVSPFQVRFCAEVPQGAEVKAWLIDTVKVGQGHPPRFLTLPKDQWLLPLDKVEVPFVAEDEDGDPLFFLLQGPLHAKLADFVAGDNGSACTLVLAPTANDLLGTWPVRVEVSDGFFLDRREFDETVYVPKCLVDSDCDDGNFCTFDSCNPVKGCQHQATPGCCNEQTSCSDGDLCTDDLCVNAACVFQPATCDDFDLCTDDSCLPGEGCAFLWNTAECDDASVCTIHDTCFKGKCLGSPIKCDDGLACTKDGCDPQTGCMHKSLCSDAILCTTDVCTPLGCKSGKTPVGTPYIEGTIDDQWPESAVQGKGQAILGSFWMQVDELNLYLALKTLPPPSHGFVFFIDSDFGAATGPAEMTQVQAQETGMPATLGCALEVKFPGFGADLAVAVQFGENPAEGPLAMGCYLLPADGLVEEVPCLVAALGDGQLEALLPWYLFYGQDAPDHEVSAIVAAAVDPSGSVVEGIPFAQMGLFADVLLFGVPDPMCLVSFCGDGITDEGEECDDGAKNSDVLPGACRSNCKLPFCGDGVVDAGELCDDGEENSDMTPDACRTNCTPPFCGDAVTDSTEECDLGPANSDVLPDVCRLSCKLPWCGDAVVDSQEQCDSGPLNSDTMPDACRTDCSQAHCGDAVKDSAEECDLGASNSDVIPNVCRTTCLLPSCGDNVADKGEECDNGWQNSDTAPDACRTDCEKAHCGDGVVDLNEGCDDGNTLDWDGCQGNCAPYTTACGDGIKTPDEQCDDGDQNSDSVPDACRTDCKKAHCGDGVVDTGEVCDDGNFADGDACGLDCKPYVASCGNGWTDPGEDCDDGAKNSDSIPDACRKNCKNPWCGDGVKDSAEQCDKGYLNSDVKANACRKTCLLPWCGDGVKDKGEQCDDGPNNLDAPNYCKTNCIAPVCGDAVLDDLLGEQCDWGDSNNDTQADACRTTCQHAHCGDKVIDSQEECDDGNALLGDGCAPDCTIETYVPEPGDIIITEIMQNPSKVYDTLGEYFEVHNTRDFEIDINKWEISDGAADFHQIFSTDPLVVPAKGFLVLGIESDPDLNGNVQIDYEYTGILLGNGIDSIIISYKGALSDAVAYDGGTAFPDPKGASMNLDPTHFDHVLNDQGASWCLSTTPLPSGDLGTPGSPNTPCP
jgi:cysteine-rich repeat protein